MTNNPHDLASLNPTGWVHSYSGSVHCWVRMPGDAEAEAATAGIAATYGAPQLAIGDSVSYRLRRWAAQSCERGRVIGFTECNAASRVVVEAEGLNVLRVLDPRPWPDGNILAH